MRQFDPAQPPRRKMKYVITDSDGNQFEHYVYCIPAGVVDRILEITGEIWGEMSDVGESGNVRLKISDALAKYPAEVIEVTSLMTGYEEADIRKWDSDILLEIILDWIDGNLKGFKETWSKKKGALGALFKEEEEAKTLLSSSVPSFGNTSGPPIISSVSDIQKSTG